MSERHDSLDKHYKDVEKLIKTTTTLFWVNASLSIAVFFAGDFQKAEEFLLFIFVITTVAYFAIDNFLSIIKIPKVEDIRRVHLLSNSFNVPLDTESTNKYYNNEVQPSLLKLGANVLENSLFAKRVTYEMLKRERIKIIALLLVFLIALILRTTDLELISILAQTLFASTLIPSYLRLELLHSKNEEIYQNLYDLFLLRKGENNDEVSDEKLSAKLLDLFVKYESAKAYSGIKQSSVIFHEINDEVSQEWEIVKRNLKIEEQQ
jgi:hypothetical protein